jgi:hypothetical protein
MAFYNDPFGSSENERKVETKFQISEKIADIGRSRAPLNRERYNNSSFL